MFVVGTAGHVDHGKSALVKALTGIDPDRLREEKERGMTIDLGFAWLRLPSGQEVSIVDVPGHERFVKNMLAGVGGIDLALLVVAADEGVMPQTREHLAILDLLQVDRGVVTITKADLVDEEWLELVRAEVEELLVPTTLAGSPIVVTSAMTGQGLPQLLAELDQLLGAMPPKRDIGRPRLPIDRIFTIAGFGTVVTGTLIDGRLRMGDEVEVLPRGRRCRIRGLQTHRQREAEALPGTRVAANLSGVAIDELERGDVVTTPGWLRPTEVVDARLRLVADLPHPLTHNADVTFHCLATESPARLRLLEGDSLQPGETGWVQLKLARPVALVKDDFFIVRSSTGTVGGGQVVDPYPKRHRRHHLPTLQSLEDLQRGQPEDLLLAALERNQPNAVAALARQANLSLAQATEATQRLLGEGQMIALGESPADGLLFSRSGWDRLEEKGGQALGGYHRQYPLRPGMPKEELRRRLGLEAKAFGPVIARWLATGLVADEGANLRLAAHQVRLSPDQERQAARFIAQLEDSPYAPAAEPLPDPELLATLIEQGRVIKAAEGIFFSARAYQAMLDAVLTHLRANGSITVAQIRDMLGTSRKYATAFIEYLGEQRITRRIGDEWKLR